VTDEPTARCAIESAPRTGQRDTRRPQPDGYQVCRPCQHTLDTDLASIDQLRLIVGRVVPQLAAAQALARPVTIGRSTEPALLGGDALNLTARTVDGVHVHLIQQLRTTRTVELLEVPGHNPVEHTEFTREPVLDTDGHPAWIPDGDQHGPLGPWVMVGRWIASWVRLRGLGENGAGGTDWLRERLDWACREHPDIAGWAGELRTTVGGLRSILGLKRHVVRYNNRCPGHTGTGSVCGAVGTLYRWIDPSLPEDDPRVRYVNCGSCGTLFDLDDERVERRVA
jgi:hypothetical protein